MNLPGKIELKAHLLQGGIALLACFLALGVGIATAALDFGVRELVIFILAFACVLFALMLTERALFLGFALWIFSLGIGWRGIWFTTNFRLYAAEALTWLLFGLILLRSIIVDRKLELGVPKLFWALLLPALWGIWIGLNNGIPADVVFAEFKLFALALPALFIVKQIIPDYARWKRAMDYLLAVALYISILGIIEFLFPSVLVPLRGFFGDAPTITSERGLVRAAFTFWGHPSVSVFLLMAFPVACYYLFVKASPTHRLFGALSAALLIVGIYIAGHRGVLLALAVAILAFALLNFRKGSWLVACGLAALPFLPAIFYANLAPILDANTNYDTSVLKRWNYFGGAAEAILKNPFWGRGWGSSGWVHNDFLQLGANLGLLALGLLLFWYVLVLWRLTKITRVLSVQKECREYAQLLIAGVMGVLVAVQFEVVISLAALAVCFWCFMALVWRYTNLPFDSEREWNIK